MKRRSLIIFVGDPPEDSGSILLNLCLWELCFSLVSPLWESCYSLALRPERAVHFLCCFLYFLLFFLFLSFLLFLPLLHSSLSSFLLFFHISFSLFPFLSHKLFPPLYSSSPLFHLSALLPFISISFSFPLSFIRALFFFFLRN